MTTPPFGDRDPLSTTPPATPIGDDVAHETGLTAPTTPPPQTSGSSGSTKGTAQQAMGSASEHASDVASTAKDEAAKVAAEAKEQAKDLLGEVRTQVDEQSKAQLHNLASKLDELADQIESMVRGSEASGTVTDVAQQLADKTHALSNHLGDRQPMDLLEDVRSYARRRPGTFLAGAAIAGIVAGRLTRGAKASQSSDTRPAGTSAAQIGDPPSVDSPLTADPDPYTEYTEPTVVPVAHDIGGRS